MDILFYSNSRGHQSVYEWLTKLAERDPADYRRAYYLLKVIGENGLLIQTGQAKNKSIKRLKGTDIWQVRVNDHRLLFFFYQDNAVVLTNHFTKKHSDTPQSEIKRAEKRKEKWLNKNN